MLYLKETVELRIFENTKHNSSCKRAKCPVHVKSLPQFTFLIILYRGFPCLNQSIPFIHQYYVFQEQSGT
jgi:hypothetical protein